MKQALVFAAGRGTRLAPLTHSVPKALAPLRHQPALQWILQRLARLGVEHVVINTHALAPQIHDFVERVSLPNVQIEISHETELLDTGGGLRRTEKMWPFPTPILLHNVDVFSTMDLYAAWNFHQTEHPLATLLAKKRPTNNLLLVDEKQNLCGVHYVARQDYRLLRRPVGELQEVGFCGVHFVEREIFAYFPDEEKFGIIPFYLQQVSEGKPIRVFDVGEAYWRDVGTLQSLQCLEEEWLAVPDLADLHRGGSPHSIRA
jgi:NDP-sugar pyrophosphorylase family protein